MRLGLYGGSFNPVHNGHLRLAVEVRERLGFDRLDLVPAARHPLKDCGGFLPLPVRWHLLRLAVADLPWARISLVEAAMSGPSYTLHTLMRYRRLLPEADLHFLLGAEDVLKLGSWHRARELTDHAHLVAVAREDVDLPTIARFAAAFWPEAERTAEDLWRFANGHSLRFLPIPRLDISATAVRDAFLAGKSLCGLVPPAVDHALRSLDPDVRCWWGEGQAATAASGGQGASPPGPPRGG